MKTITGRNMMESQSIKIKALVFMTILFLFACSSNTNANNLYVEKCAKNSFVFTEKKEKIIASLKQMGVINDYFVLKHGAASEPFYSFSLVGIKQNEGLFLYLDDSMITPTQIKMDYDIAVNLINTGKLIFSKNNDEKFSHEGVNGAPCYFINFVKQDESVTYALSGRSKTLPVTNFLRKMESLALNIEFTEGNKDLNPLLDRDVHGLSLENIFDEISVLKRKRH